jgi:hypothetical protein
MIQLKIHQWILSTEDPTRVGLTISLPGHFNMIIWTTFAQAKLGVLVGLEKNVELLVSCQNLTQISWLHLIWSWKFWLHVKTSSSIEFDPKLHHLIVKHKTWKWDQKRPTCKGIDLAIYLLIVFLSILLLFFFFFFLVHLGFMVVNLRVYLDYPKVRDLMRIVIAFDKDYIILNLEIW